MLSQVELELFGKVLLAGLLGFVVGLERELMGSAARDRTFSLVAIGSALFTALSLHGCEQEPDNVKHAYKHRRSAPVRTSPGGSRGQDASSRSANRTARSTVTPSTGGAVRSPRRRTRVPSASVTSSCRSGTFTIQTSSTPPRR
jgi:hypothetical protein